MYMHVCHAFIWMSEDQRTTGGKEFSPSTMRGLGLELPSLGLAAGAFTPELCPFVFRSQADVFYNSG